MLRAVPWPARFFKPNSIPSFPRVVKATTTSPTPKAVEKLTAAAEHSISTERSFARRLSHTFFGQKPPENEVEQALLRCDTKRNKTKQMQRTQKKKEQKRVERQKELWERKREEREREKEEHRRRDKWQEKYKMGLEKKKKQK